jgi:hypothetical protein
MSTYVDLDSVWRDRSCYTDPCNYQLTPNQVSTWNRSTREVVPLPQNPNNRPLDFVNSVHVIGASLPYPRIELYAKNFVTVESITSNTLSTTQTVANDQILMTSSPGYANTIGILRNVEYHVVNAAPGTFQLSLTEGGAAISLTDSTGTNIVFAQINPSDYVDIIALLQNAVQLVSYPRVYLDFYSLQYKSIRLLNTNNGVLPDAKFVLGIDRIQYDDKLTPIWIHYKSHGEQVYRYKRDDPVIIRFMSRDGSTIPFFDEPDLTVPTNPIKQSLVTLNVTPYVRDASFVNQNVDPLM